MWLWISVVVNIIFLLVFVYAWFLLVSYARRIVRLKKVNRQLRVILGSGAIGSMKAVDRSIAIIKPRQPYVDWVNTFHDAADQKNIGDLSEDITAYLIPVYDSDEEAMAYIRRKHKEIFERRLADCYVDKSRWPRGRNYEKFLEWFDLELHSEVIDMSGGVISKACD